MSIGLFLICYPLAIAFVIFFEPFGPVTAGASTVLGGSLFFLFGALFLSFPQKQFYCYSQKKHKVTIISLTISTLMIGWLYFIIQNFGYPAFIYFLKGESIPPEVLHGEYRDMLPLRGFVPPLMLALTISSITFREKGLLNMFALLLTVTVSILLVGIYETRHVLLWVFIYIFFQKFFYMKSLMVFKNKMSYVVLFIAIGSIFVLLGNLRSGLSLSDNEYFATGMGLSPIYSQLPLPVLWALIYLFSGIARGIANYEYIPYLASYIPPKLFPGFFQEDLDLPKIPLSDSFSEQKFAIDAWHTYALQFGIIGALLLCTLIFLTYFLLIIQFRRMLNNNKTVPGWFYVLILWFSVRIFLLIIGDYFLDSAAFVELFCLIVFFKLSNFKLTAFPKNYHG